MIKLLPLLSLLSQSDEEIFGAFGIFGTLCGGLLGLAFAIFQLIAVWKIFTKAGKPGWAALIPIYNTLTMLEIVGREWWWLLLMLIPGVNVVIAIIILFDLAKSFGKDTGFGFGLLFLSAIFIPILGFGKAQYVGPAAKQM